MRAVREKSKTKMDFAGGIVTIADLINEHPFQFYVLLFLSFNCLENIGNKVRGN